MTSPDDSEPAEAQAPPVVAAVVTHDAGPWLEDCLASLAAQDYPNLSVLVIDTGSADDTIARVAKVLPSAYVRRRPDNPGFGAAANDVLEVVDGAAFYAFCHDDVLLDPTAIRALVEEAYRSNAGVVGPKLVRWGEPDRLLHVGQSADKAGVPARLVERDELDQEQHDAVRDVFLLPGACTLVRSDLFAILGGYDPAITFVGDDLDLCWRAQVAGSRVMVVPAARAQHRESLGDRLPDRRTSELAPRHRLRVALTCYGLFHLVRVIPQIALLAVAEMGYSLVSGRRQRAADLAAAWMWNLRRIPELRERRRALRAIRQFPDSEVRRLQVPGSARMRSYLRGELHAGDRIRAAFSDVGRELSGTLASGSRRLVVAAWVLVTVLFVGGSRDLLLQELPDVAGLTSFETSPLDLLRAYASGWRTAGLGSEAPAPTAFGLLGLLGLPLLGGMGLLQQILVLGTLPVGVAGAWRLTRGLGSRAGRAAGVVVYAVVPLPYDALSRGSWGGLLLYAAAPWLLARLIDAAGGTSGEESREGWVWGPRRMVVLGLLLALVGAFVPLVLPLVLVVAVGLWLGGLLAGTGRSSSGAVTVAAGAAVVAALLHVPWTFDFALPGSDWWAAGGVSPIVTDPLGMASLLRFETGGVGVSSLGWAIPVAAALPLLIGAGWRFTWAVRCWCIALACWALTWLGGQGHLGVGLPPADVLLAPAAAALAFAAALGVVAFERDLRGYHFGWRQIVSIGAAAGVVIAVVPIAGSAIDGRWELPEADFATALSVLEQPEVREGGAYRVLWLGDPAVLPVAGFRLGDDLAYGLSRDGAGALTERWSASAFGPTTLVGDALRLAAEGQTDRLGRLLAPMAIRYVALPERAAPERARSERRPVPTGLLGTVARQLDLRRIEVDPAIVVYENAAWAPARASLPAEAIETLDTMETFRTSAAVDLSSASPVLPDREGHVRFEGDVPAGTVYLAEAAAAGWQLEVHGDSAERRRVLGWANAFAVPEGGPATLRYNTSPLRWLAIALQVLLWVAAVLFVVRSRRRPGMPT